MTPQSANPKPRKANRGNNVLVPTGAIPVAAVEVSADAMIVAAAVASAVAVIAAIARAANRAAGNRVVSENAVLTGLGYAVVAILLALLVIIPVFFFVSLIYDDGHGLTPLMIVVFAVWLLLAWLLRRRKITL